MWKATQWSQCSQTCGRNGVRHRTIYCQKHDNLDYLQTVSDRECELNAGSAKPPTEERCNQQRCEWRTGSWATCSLTEVRVNRIGIKKGGDLAFFHKKGQKIRNEIFRLISFFFAKKHNFTNFCVLADPEFVDDSYDAVKKYAEHRDQPTLNSATRTHARSTM